VQDRRPAAKRCELESAIQLHAGQRHDAVSRSPLVQIAQRLRLEPRHRGVLEQPRIARQRMRRPPIERGLDLRSSRKTDQAEHQWNQPRAASITPVRNSARKIKSLREV
jgi:hypothetical protein